MTPGAYSVVRYSNSLNDQRINLGVLLWHPVDGFKCLFTPSLDRVKAIDPRIQLQPLKEQLAFIEAELGQIQGDGRQALLSLSQAFKDGLEVSVPYPARLPSLLDSADKLYETLVSPVAEVRRASTQKKFTRQFSNILAVSFKEVFPKGKYEEIGFKPVNGVEVDVGFRTTGQATSALWRPLSLQSRTRRVDQLADAKAITLDMKTVRTGLTEFKNAKQYVVVQPPKPRHSDGLKDVIEWMRHGADDVLIADDLETLAGVLRPTLLAIK